MRGAIIPFLETRYFLLSKKILNIVIICCALLSFGFNQASAENTVRMSLTSSSKSVKVGDNFDVVLSITGNGQKFTSFKSDLILNNIAINSLKKGAATKWLQAPTSESPNFFGAVAGQIENIEVYTLNVKIINAGEASLLLQNSTVYSTDGYTVNSIIASVDNLVLKSNNPNTSNTVIEDTTVPTQSNSNPTAANSNPNVANTTTSQVAPQAQSNQTNQNINGNTLAALNLNSNTAQTQETKIGSVTIPQNIAVKLKDAHSILSIKNITIVSCSILAILVLIISLILLRKKRENDQANDLQYNQIQLTNSLPVRQDYSAGSQNQNASQENSDKIENHDSEVEIKKE